MLRRAVLHSLRANTIPNLRCFASSTSTHGADVSEIQDVKELEKLIGVESERKAIIIDFYANWCNPCKTLTPRLVKALEGKSRSIKICLLYTSDAADE